MAATKQEKSKSIYGVCHIDETWTVNISRYGALMNGYIAKP
jgi:hypothetical protein